MGNFSKDTFDKLKHYVGVRLQQGVPLVDADWNEQEDIRRYELQAFLKWFVGNGVPEGNDGFRIISIVNKIILTSKKNEEGVSSVEVNQENSTAAKILGFGPSNYLASRAAPPAAQLTGEVTGDFEFKEKGLTLVVSANGMPKETVTFRRGTFTAAQVAEAINSAMKNLTASAGDGNDFDIKGGDGTAEGAGRCLVEGWDAINESDLKYSAQPLFDNKKLAGGKKWDVEPVKPLTTPKLNRTDTVYLDVWEREVNALEDKDLFNRDIGVGVETCVRLKREWVVRVAQGTNETKQLDAPPVGHVYYPLATLERVAKKAAINQKDIKDLRRTGVAVSPEEITIKDGNVGIGTLTPQNKLQLGCGDIAIGDNKHRAGKIRLWQEPTNEDDYASYAIGTEKLHNIYGAGKKYANSIGHRFYRGGGELIAQIGVGGPGNPANRLNSYFAGNVGIGTTSPTKKLDVNTDTDYDGIYLNDVDGTTKGRLVRARGGWAYFQLNDAAGINKVQLNSKGNSYFNGGNVGIGTARPSDKLTISEGDLKIEGEKARSLKIVSSRSGAGIDLVAVTKDEPNEWDHPYIDFTHGKLDGSNYDIRIYAPAQGQLVIKGGKVGIGTPPTKGTLDVLGRCYSWGWDSSGSDYAEYFESVDGSEITVGTSVTLTKDAKIGPAKKGDVPIGIITTNSAIVGNSYKEWPKKYLRDEFGNQIMGEYKEEVMIPKKEKIKKERQKVEKKTITEEVTRTEIVLEKGKYIQKEISESIAREIEEPLFEEVDVYDATGKKVIGKHKVPVMETYEKEIDVLDENGEPVLVGSGEFVTKERPKSNPEYDESQEYVSREQRQEWNCVGLLGQLPLRKGQPVAPTWIKIKDISKEVELWLVR